MEETKKETVDVVFIGRGDMYATLHREDRDTSFIAASVTYHGLVRDPRTEVIVSHIDAKKISDADKVFIICAREDELKEYVEKLKALRIEITKDKFVVLTNAKKDKLKGDLKKDLERIPFSGTKLENLQNRLVQLYPDREPDALKNEFEEHKRRKSAEKKAPSSPTHGPNPHADLPEKQEEMARLTGTIEICSTEITEIVARDQINDKDIVDQAMTRLEKLKIVLNTAVQKYKARIENENANVKAAMNKPVDDISEKANIFYNAAVDAKRKLDEKVEEAARIRAERDAEIAAAVLARRQRLAELQDQRIRSVVAFEVQEGITKESLEEYFVSAKPTTEGMPDVFCVVFDPNKDACEDHLYAAVERIKRFQSESNPAVRVVFLRAVPYVATTSGHFGDLEATSEQDSDVSMITRFGIENPVIITNLREFKDKAAYGQPVVFSKKKEEMSPSSPISPANSSFVVDEGAERPAKKQKPAPNPHRFTFGKVKHARHERKAELNKYFETHGEGKPNAVNLDWLDIQLLSMERSCETAREIRARENVGPRIDARCEDNARVDQVRYKVVIDLLKFLDKEERRLKPKVKTFFAWYEKNDYLIKRDAQRKLIYHVAEKLFQELENNPGKALEFTTVNRILDEQSRIYPKEGHVHKGILKAVRDNFPAEIKDLILFPAEVARMEPAAAVGRMVSSN